uniref:Uncharacterized protein n=1 Tax=Trichogramma kaykai TaxID=54128 RepID=A0ABD2XE35_9HYME
MKCKERKARESTEQLDDIRRFVAPTRNTMTRSHVNISRVALGQQQQQQQWYREISIAIGLARSAARSLLHTLYEHSCDRARYRFPIIYIYMYTVQLELLYTITLQGARAPVYAPVCVSGIYAEGRKKIEGNIKKGTEKQQQQQLVSIQSIYRT